MNKPIPKKVFKAGRIVPGFAERMEQMKTWALLNGLSHNSLVYYLGAWAGKRGRPIEFIYLESFVGRVLYQ